MVVSTAAVIVAGTDRLLVVVTAAGDVEPEVVSDVEAEVVADAEAGAETKAELRLQLMLKLNLYDLLLRQQLM